MPYRRLPITDATRLLALEKAKRKIEQEKPEQKAFGDELYRQLVEILPVFAKNVHLRGKASKEFESAEYDFVLSTEILKRHVSHFVIVFNLAVDRAVYKSSDRKYYKLSSPENNLSGTECENDLLEWVFNITEGEAARLLEGGRPMSNPSSEEVKAACDHYMKAKKTAAAKKKQLDSVMEFIDTCRPQTDGLISKIWNEVESFFRQEDIEFLKKKASEYGVCYVTRLDETLQNQAEETSLL